MRRGDRFLRLLQILSDIVGNLHAICRPSARTNSLYDPVHIIAACIAKVQWRSISAMMVTVGMGICFGIEGKKN
jgi:hypothetical protein